MQISPSFIGLYVVNRNVRVPGADKLTSLNISTQCSLWNVVNTRNSQAKLIFIYTYSAKSLIVFRSWEVCHSTQRKSQVFRSQFFFLLWGVLATYNPAWVFTRWKAQCVEMVDGQPPSVLQFSRLKYLGGLCYKYYTQQIYNTRLFWDFLRSSVLEARRRRETVEFPCMPVRCRSLSSLAFSLIGVSWCVYHGISHFQWFIISFCWLKCSLVGWFGRIWPLVGPTYCSKDFFV